MIKQIYSIKKRLFFVTCLIFACFAGITLLCNFTFTSLLRKSSHRSLMNTLEIYDKQLSDDLKALETYLLEINEYNMDVSLLNNTYTPEISLNITRLKNLLGSTLPSFTQADGLFTFSAANDIFVMKYKESGNYEYARYLREMFRRANGENRLDELDTLMWSVQFWDGKYHLIRIIRRGNLFTGAWADLENLTSPFGTLTGYEGDVFFVDSSGKALVPPGEDDNLYDPEKMAGRFSLYRKNDGSRFVSAAVRLAYSPYFLVALGSLRTIDRQLISLYWTLFLLAGAILILTPVVLYLLNKLWNEPLSRLRTAIATLHTGSYDVQISLDEIRCREFIQVYETFNDMVAEIHKLRISVYEEKIIRSEFELQYLKSQLAPHFLINCLYSISTLSGDPNGGTIIQDMISHLTEHLRYTLSSKNRVSLSEELQFVENYILLAQLRAPESIRYEIKVDREIGDGSVFPMMILMFTENTIKHNLIVGEMLEISIGGVRETRDGMPFIHLTHIDSGDGFPEGLLQALAEARYDADSIDWGGHIGVCNTFKRLEIVFDKRGEILCSNEPGRGARIDIYLPYEPFERERQGSREGLK